MQVRYGEVWGEEHGGTGGAYSSFTLNPGASIVIVQVRSAVAHLQGRSHSEIDAIEFITDDGQVQGWCGWL